MVASGSVAIKSGAGAQWSFVRQGSSDTAPQAVDSVAGVPLIRQGPLSSASPPPPSITPPPPYRFADGVDLYVTGTTSPSMEYSLVHATGSQRVLFRRPKVEADGLDRITSVVPAFLADMFSLGTGTGPFPTAQTCFTLTEPTGDDYYLQISTGGNLTLSLAPITITTPTARILVQSNNFVGEVYASRVPANSPTKITLLIDTTSSTTPWSLDVTGLTVVTTLGQYGEMYNFTGSIHSDNTAPTSFNQNVVGFGSGLQPVQSAVGFLKHLGPLIPFTVSLTNDWGFTALLSFDIDKWLNFLSQPSVPGGSVAAGIIRQFVDTVDFKSGVKGTMAQVNAIVEIDVTLLIPVSTFVVVIILNVIIDIGSDGSQTLEVDFGGGLGLGFNIGPLRAYGYVAIFAELIMGADVVGLGIGGGFIVKAGVGFPAVSTSILGALFLTLDISGILFCSFNMHVCLE
jgi:hypothetical protein